jgi:hypothetical protein
MVSLAILAAGIQPALADVRRLTCELTDLYAALMDWLNLLFWHSLHR